MYVHQKGRVSILSSEKNCWSDTENITVFMKMPAHRRTVCLRSKYVDEDLRRMHTRLLTSACDWREEWNWKGRDEGRSTSLPMCLEILKIICPYIIYI